MLNVECVSADVRKFVETSANAVMKHSVLPISMMLGLGMWAGAATVDVTSFKYAGPYPLMSPYEIDSIDNSTKPFDRVSLLDTPISIDLARSGRLFAGATLDSIDGCALHLLSFTLDNSRYASATLKVDGIKNYRIFVDGKKVDSGDLKLKPSTREIVLKCLTDSASADSIKVALETERPELFTVNPVTGRRYTTKDIFTGKFLRSVDVSPSGKYLYTGYYYNNEDGTSASEYRLTDVTGKKLIQTRQEQMTWMPKSDKLYFTRVRDNKTQLVTLDPASGEEVVVVRDLPEKYFEMSPTEDFLVYRKVDEGPKEKSESLYEIVNPEDRQPGWRERGQLMKYDLATGLSQPLTFGHKYVSLCGISDDGGKLLFTYSDLNLTKRPTTLYSLYLLDLSTMKAECLVDRDGFMAAASLSPDGRKVALMGSPEAFDGVGKNVDEGLTPSMYDYQLYVMDISSRKVLPLTRDFNPSVEAMEWSREDGRIYFTALDGDARPIYRADPNTGKVENLNAPETYVKSFAVSSASPVGAYYGQSPDNSYRLYTFNTKSLKPTLVDDISAERTDGINLDKTYRWNYVTSRGDTIQASYNLPPDFDSTKSYPMIVYYYGGCSPTSRILDTTYNPHLFAANGYVALVINPSGAAGFGQNFSARHVATAGDGVAQDIIEGVRQFTSEHPYVNASKIGCCGASYGGFMTQYLQIQTDIFAAAVSHAGISDHTSYWGEGYWGYSYSEVSMAHKYPWSDSDLYVSHSPLYNADKVNTPILFLHGDADTNVPVGESIQMFTALKLLGKETAMVAVKGENHHILEFGKREEWMNTIFAWFAKYLQDDPDWWNEMYPPKSL